MEHYEVAVIGGGIVGLATAYTLLKNNPHLKLALFEKEKDIAMHQTGHNSGVIHSGIYYKPGSLKAQNCVQGVDLLLEFCKEHEIPYNLCGKVIVATSNEELPRLKELYKRGIANKVKGLKLLAPDELKKIEPYCKGVQAIYSPNTGIVDYKKVSIVLLQLIQNFEAQVYLNTPIQNMTESNNLVILKTPHMEVSANQVINCAGLYSDHVAKMTQPIKEKIIPFRGEYYFLSKDASYMLNGLIYPVPNPKFPFLGVHLTRRITGEVELGPNAVLALGKESYKKSDFNLKETLSTLKYRGFWSMSGQHWKTGLYELYRSYSKKAFLKDIQRLVPEIREKDLIPGGSGVRAQAVSPIGKIIDDFLIYNDKRVLNILNAPSPGATSCLSIGGYINKLLALQGSKSLINKD